MDSFDRSVIKTGMNSLKEEIKNKYKEYHLLNRDQFPEFEYNTNRANYEPLRQSFEEEFFVVRGVDRMKNSIHIPSTNTLVLIFCDDNYVPSKKILDTCRSYVTGKTQVAISDAVASVPKPKATMPVKSGRLLLAILLVLAGLVIYVATTKVSSTSAASGLIVTRPANGKIVPRQLLVKGKASNADTVWLVVHALGGNNYWVQPPVKVEADGTWEGGIYIGSVDEGDIGVTSQLRAFINPINTLQVGEVLHSWPKAELSSSTLEVVRGPKETEE